MPDTLGDVTHQQVNLGFELRGINEQLQTLCERVALLKEVYPASDIRTALLQQGQRDHDNVFDNVDALRRKLDSYLVPGGEEQGG